MPNQMMPEDREAMSTKIMEIVKLLSDEELMDLAKELGAENAVGEDDKKDGPPLLMTQAKPVVDTGTLTGPIGGLKNFLLKSARENEKV